LRAVTRLVDRKRLARYGDAPPGADERLRAVGALDGPQDRPAVFAFYVMIFGGPDVPHDAREFAHSLAEAVVVTLRGAPWSSKLDSLTISPILLNPSIGVQADRATHSRNGNVGIDINLDFADWMRASDAERRRRLAQCLAWGVRRIAPSHIGEADRARVLEALQGVATRLLHQAFVDDGTSGPVTHAPPPEPQARVLKLYRVTPDSKEYWETWRDPATGSHLIHTGKLGTRGRVRTLGPQTSNPAATMAREEAGARAAGFCEIAIEDHSRLVVELPFDPRTRKNLVTARHRCEDLCNEALGWSGLGHCDGGDSGGKAMRGYCFVVDYPLAAKVLRQALDEHGFGASSKIHDLSD